MASNRGVNTITTTNAARNIKIESSTPIGMVATAMLDQTKDAEIIAKLAENHNMLHYGSVTKALEVFADSKGTIRETLDSIDDQDVKCPVIISLVQIDEEDLLADAEDFYDNDEIKSKIIIALGSLKKAYSLFGDKPNLIIAPRFSHDKDVSAEIEVVASSLLATGYVDLFAEDEADINIKVQEFGTKRLLLCDPYLKAWDTSLNITITKPLSACVAGMRARVDGEVEYGWADSCSNQVILGISGTSRVVEFEAGQECEADRITTKGVSTVIRYNGYRLWGEDTTDIDPIWQCLTRVRVFDRVCEAALDGLFWAIDKRANKLKEAKDSVEQMLLALKGSEVLIGFSVFWDEEKNTLANITAGKFYLVAQMQNMPIVKRFEVNFSYVDRYGDVLIKQIS